MALNLKKLDGQSKKVFTGIKCTYMWDTDYIPEQVFYMLAMKANNEAAKEFQRKIAYELFRRSEKQVVIQIQKTAIIPYGKFVY